ncbi:MAG: hypothetical protein U0941_29985 [Planctomycetaceae bacterium]
MPSPTFAEQMVTKLQQLLLANPLATSITIDGTTTTFADAQQRLEHYQSIVAREQGTRKPFNPFPLGGFAP